MPVEEENNQLKICKLEHFSKPHSNLQCAFYSLYIFLVSCFVLLIWIGFFGIKGIISGSFFFPILQISLLLLFFIWSSSFAGYPKSQCSKSAVWALCADSRWRGAERKTSCSEGCCGGFQAVIGRSKGGLAQLCLIKVSSHSVRIRIS